MKFLLLCSTLIATSTAAAIKQDIGDVLSVPPTEESGISFPKRAEGPLGQGLPGLDDLGVTDIVEGVLDGSETTEITDSVTGIIKRQEGVLEDGSEPVKRSDGSFEDGVPFDPKTGKGAVISGTPKPSRMRLSVYQVAGGTNHPLDLQNPNGLGQQSTDAGTVPNLKWSFSLSKTNIFPGGWTRTQVVQDLPQSKDIAGAQQHLRKGAIRELHWHKVVSISANGSWLALTLTRLSGVLCMKEKSWSPPWMRRGSIRSRNWVSVTSGTSLKAKLIQCKALARRMSIFWPLMMVISMLLGKCNNVQHIQ